MITNYIFRLDDICEQMDWEKFLTLKTIFDRYQIKPLIGVIPDNHDPIFDCYVRPDFDFWNYIKALKNDLNWSIALHGYQHRYTTRDSGILNLQPRSEFAGVSRDLQCVMIHEGIRRLAKADLRPEAFMAPSHSFDQNTLSCLVKNGLDVITDGYGLVPYRQHAVLFIPQLTALPRKIYWPGVYTFCLHTNELKAADFERIERFIQENRHQILSFADCVQVWRDKAKPNVIMFGFLKALFKFLRTLRKVLRPARKSEALS